MYLCFVDTIIIIYNIYFILKQYNFLGLTYLAINIFWSFMVFFVLKVFGQKLLWVFYCILDLIILGASYNKTFSNS